MIIFFIGYMGCGKSYVVNKLANDLQLIYNFIRK